MTTTMFSIGIVGSCCSRVCVPSVASVNTIVVTMRAQSVRVLRCRSRSREKRLHAFTNRDCDTMQTHYRTFAAPVCMCVTGGGALKTQVLDKKLSYHRGTARCVASIEFLPIATQQCRNYLYDKSWPNRWYEVGDLVGGNA